MFPVTLFFVPAVEPVMFTVIAHELLAAKLPPDKLTVPVPGAAVTVPPHVFVTPLVVETIKPEGNASVNASPAKAVAVLLLASENVNEVEPFSGILTAPNALLMVGGEFTVTVALEVFPVPASFEVTVTLLFLTPVVVPTTFTETLHVAPLAIVPLANATLVSPATALAVPPHEFVRFGGAATFKPEGKLSVNAIPVKDNVFADGLVIAKDNVVVPFSGMFVAPNAFVIDGAVATVRFALAVFPVPPFVDVTFPVVFVYCPETAPVTVTLNWH